MNQIPYPFTRNRQQYTFTSTGKNNIAKLVQFTRTNIPRLYNLAFGDLRPDGTLDDNANSNNGDMVRILSTVVHIAKDFLNRHPNVKIGFTGNTASRTALYHRILTKHYDSFSGAHVITALVRRGNRFIELNFPLITEEKYLAFFVTKK
jgi:hypothetical protein